MQRQPPAELAGRGACSLDLCEPGVVVREQARVRRAERDDDRAGQRREVDDPLGALLHGVGEGVGEDEAALGVGVVDLDRLAVHRGDDVAGLHRASARHVLGRGHDSRDPDRKPESGDGAERLDHRGAAGHVELHLVHLCRGLDRDPARVEGHRLAHVAEVRARAAALVAEHDQLRLRVRALRDRGKGAHAARDDLVAPEGLERQLWMRVRDLARPLRESRGCEHVRGQVLEVARCVLRAGTKARLLDCRGLVDVGGHLERVEPVGATRIVVVVRGLVAVEAVEGEQRPLDQRARDALARRRRPRQRLGPELARTSGGDRRRDARLLGVELAALAESGDQHAATVLVEDGHLLQARLRLAGLDEGLESGLVEALAVEQPDHPRVGSRVGSGPLSRADLQGVAA